MQHSTLVSTTGNNDMTEYIAPCPFCGHTPIDLRGAIHPTGQGWRDDPIGEGDKMLRHYMRRDDPRGIHGLSWTLGCLEHEGGCGADMRGDSRPEVIANWNRRYEP